MQHTTMPLLDNFRENLIRRIDETHESKTAVAERAGIHRVTLHKIIAGEFEPSLEMVEKLAKTLGFTPIEKIFEPSSKKRRS